MWQPIETAPKDRDVLLYCPKCGVVRGRWKAQTYHSKPKPYWTNDRERLYGVIETRNDQPTHWAPLPDAPSVQAQPTPSVCTWVEDEGVWHSDCGGAVWQFTDEGPAENGMKFCLACGRPLEVLAPEAKS